MTETHGLALACRNLGRRFRTPEGELVAVEDVSFQVGAGEFVSVVGPSGCGKTTLLRMIAGLLSPSAGEISFAAIDRRDRPRLALVFQEHGLFPWMSVVDNVAFALEDHPISRHERRERAREFVERVGLGRFGTLYPGQLSRGMRQRVNLARAFARDPQLLLLDEPFASLDAQSRRVLQEELLARWHRHPNTVLFVTHDIEEAVLLADRVLLMSDSPGRIVEEMPIALARPRDLTAWESEAVRQIRRHLWQRLAAATRRDLALVEEGGT